MEKEGKSVQKSYCGESWGEAGDKVKVDLLIDMGEEVAIVEASSKMTNYVVTKLERTVPQTCSYVRWVSVCGRKIPGRSKRD